MTKNNASPTGGLGGKIRFSLVLKLNARFLLRLFSVFLSADLLFCIVSAVCVTMYAENSLASVARALQTAPAAISSDPNGWTQATGYEVTALAEPMSGLTVSAPLRFLYPKETASAAHNVTLPSGSANTILQRLSGLKLSVGCAAHGQAYALSIIVGPIVTMLRRILTWLLIFEALALFSTVFSGSRMIRKTLRPLEELAQTARTLNTDSGAFSPEEMEALAGKLNSINASRLDTRISLDTTQDELKNLAASINGMLDRINASYRSQVQFVSDASHELRTPISVIQGYANLLDRWGKKDEKTLQESIDAIKEETANMKLLVEQLLFLARGDNNTMTLQMEPFDLSELADEILQETRMIDAGHEYSARLSPVRVRADRALVKQGMRILVDNAIKYTQAGGQIALSVAVREKEAVCTVQDDGIGIPPGSVPKIFNRFYRSDESRARATGGTGLGLSIAKWIADRHLGHLEVLSRENIGTRISFVLPAEPEEMLKATEG